MFEAAGVVDEPFGEVFIALAGDFSAVVGEGGRSGQECPLSISGQFEAPGPLVVIGSDGEALAIEIRAPLLAGIAGGECAVFLPVGGMASRLIRGTDAGPVRGGEAFRWGFRSGRLRGEGEAAKTGEEEWDGFHDADLEFELKRWD